MSGAREGAGSGKELPAGAFPNSQRTTRPSQLSIPHAAGSSPLIQPAVSASSGRNPSMNPK